MGRLEPSLRYRVEFVKGVGRHGFVCSRAERHLTRRGQPSFSPGLSLPGSSSSLPGTPKDQP